MVLTFPCLTVFFGEVIYFQEISKRCKWAPTETQKQIRSDFSPAANSLGVST